MSRVRPCCGPDRWKTATASVSKGAEKGRRERGRERERQSRGIKAEVAAEPAVTVHVRGVVERTILVAMVISGPKRATPE